MVSTDGDTDHWETRMLVSDPKSAAEILDVLKNRIKANTSHTRGPVALSEQSGNRSATSSEIKWKFTDDHGLRWQGVGIVEKSLGEKGTFILTLKLSRSANFAVRS